jgi:hypothetical protein
MIIWVYELNEALVLRIILVRTSGPECRKMGVETRQPKAANGQTPSPKKRVRLLDYEAEDHDNSLNASHAKATPARSDVTSRRFLTVGVRLRPESSDELRDKHFLSCVSVIEGEEGIKGEVEMQRSYQDTRRYAFDHVFNPSSQNR